MFTITNLFGAMYMCIETLNDKQILAILYQLYCSGKHCHSLQHGDLLQTRAVEHMFKMKTSKKTAKDVQNIDA